MKTKIYFKEDGNLSYLNEKVIAFVDYGNKAKSQALNIRDSGFNVIIGTLNENYKQQAQNDGFKTVPIAKATLDADFIFLSGSENEIKKIFNKEVKPNLNENKTLIFSDGYYVTFGVIKPNPNLDILLISPRVSEKSLREQYLNKKGFYSFIGVYQDYSKKAKKNLLALTKAIGGLTLPSIELSFKQQSILNLFTEQAFYPALNQILIKSIINMLQSGYPPEAIFIELILSEELIFTVEKMIEVGLIKQMGFHSQTSQYGSLSRSIKFRKFNKSIGLVQKKILNEIENGNFSKEWENKDSILKLEYLKHFACNTDFSKVEKIIRSRLFFPERKLVERIPRLKEEESNEIQGLTNEIQNFQKYYKEFSQKFEKLEMKSKIYYEKDGNLTNVKNKIIAIIGYGNQGRSQALNMRDSGLEVIVGNRNDEYRTRAEKDGFKTFSISDAVKKADCLFLLIPDEIMGDVYKSEILPYLKDYQILIFASGYNIAFDLVKIPNNIDILLIAPRMIGIGVRERFLIKKGFYSFVGVHQDVSGNALNILLGLCKGIGTLQESAIEVTFMEEAVMDLFTEQGFGPLFGVFLLKTTTTLIEAGYPIEAVLIELILSGQMKDLYSKMINYGLFEYFISFPKRTQYGILSKGIEFEDIMKKMFKLQKEVIEHIENGGFAEEWEKRVSKIKFKLIKFFAPRIGFGKIERKVRKIFNNPRKNSFSNGNLS